MPLSPDDIEKFRQIWFDEYGEELQIAEAAVIAERFLEAVHMIVTLADRARAKTEGRKEPPAAA